MLRHRRLLQEREACPSASSEKGEGGQGLERGSGDVAGRCNTFGLAMLGATLVVLLFSSFFAASTRRMILNRFRVILVIARSRSWLRLTLELPYLCKVLLSVKNVVGGDLRHWLCEETTPQHWLWGSRTDSRFHQDFKRRPNDALQVHVSLNK